MSKKISTALVSVFNKDGLEPIIKKLNDLGVKLYSTGGTFEFIQKLNIPVIKVEDITQFPEILGGRVKTLHPKIFGGILFRRDNKEDNVQIQHHSIPPIDCVIVDLYPFEDTVKSTKDEQAIIEKIDIGGIALIRAAAKNFKDVLIVPHKNFYSEFLNLLETKNGQTDIDDRKKFAAYAFAVSSHYDTMIFKYFNSDFQLPYFKESFLESKPLRYGENPHQKAYLYPFKKEGFEQLNGKEISYNNLLDIDAAVQLINDFSDPTFAIIKHNNACGVATRSNIYEAYLTALSSDPLSAFGGVLVANRKIDLETAKEINKLFFEVLIAPDYDKDALEILKSKANRIILLNKLSTLPDYTFRSVINGVLYQERDKKIETKEDLKCVTEKCPSESEVDDLLFANKIVKHTKSNAIVIVKNKQLIGSGTGQTSRVDAVRHAIEKAHKFNFDTKGAVLASDAFFPFPDNVDLAHSAGITAIIQPGGSIKDKDSIDACNKYGISMVFTGVRHFKH
ncbi:MAG TPA: bifunctional phosphoribosylaminoimidazolecarboxamide formyltransferase/IMP cyclohydrolase [Bacteroidia bacterium]|nr:bifunctional phosphoribosylaminoimidazolecarboxamide formyltransferase/IMP cyclohydrolase [Bacteroidia bacterium]